ncbi:MAG: glycosyltransferase family 2 protein [Clostridium perfringens]
MFKKSEIALVSVVIPLYNCEKYIEECILSLIKQTYKCLEIIVVDDGSNDNGYQIVNKISENDSRVRLIKKQNGGVGSARNYGISHSKGDYIIFVDSDDTLSDRAIELLVKNTNEDCLAFLPTTLTDSKKIKGFDKRKFIYNYFHTREGVPYGCLGKLYKSSIIREKNISFSEELICDEDVFFNLDYFKNIKFGIQVEEALYKVRIHSESLTKTRKKDNIPVYIEAYKMICNEYDENIKLDICYANAYSCFILTLNDCFTQIRCNSVSKKERFKIINSFAKNTTIRNIIDNYYLNISKDSATTIIEKYSCILLKYSNILFTGYVECIYQIIRIKGLLNGKR